MNAMNISKHLPYRMSKKVADPEVPIELLFAKAV